MKISLLIIILLVFSFSAFGQTGKITAEEIVQKHLASIGTADTLASVKSIIAVGNAKFISRTAAIVGEENFNSRTATLNLAGVAQLGSESDKYLLAMIFGDNRYPYEKAGYDGQNFSISFHPNGARTVLGDFFKSHTIIFKEGLAGGSLSSAWSLLNVNAGKPRLDYAGTEKINNRQVYKLKYSPRKGAGELRIQLLFDAETFRHIQTEYKYTQSSRMATSPTEAVKQSDTYYKLVEEFSEFKSEGKVTLPHKYKIIYTAVLKEQSQWLEWTMNFSTFVFNQQIDAKAFDVSASK